MYAENEVISMSDINQLSASVFDIQRYSVHDGPGIRTTVFFKGCNLRCRWCHNPESLRALAEVMVYPDKCVGCGACEGRCEAGALSFGEAGPAIDRAKCVGCLACAAVCYSGALSVAGKTMSVQDVLDVVKRDAPFYESSDGGMTCSGGEPLLQSEFVAELSRRAKECGLHTALDTALCVPWEHVARAAPFTDLFLVDVKAADETLHRRVTGVSNALIMENLRRLAGSGARVWVRVPLVPGVAGEAGEIAAIARMLCDIRGIERVQLLNFHRMAEAKYRALGLEYPAADMRPLDGDQVRELALICHNLGVEAAFEGND